MGFLELGKLRECVCVLGKKRREREREKRARGRVGVGRVGSSGFGSKNHTWVTGATSVPRGHTPR